MTDYYLLYIFLVAIFGFLISLVLTRLSLPRIMEFMKKHGITGKDVHKEDKPEIPEMGGVSVYISVIITGIILTVVSFIFYPNKFFSYQLLGFILATIIGGAIGIVDDKFRLGGKVKPILLTLGAVPILIINFYILTICNPYPYFPLIGSFTINIVYYLIIPIAFTLTSNAMNMLDVVNGSMTGSSVIIFVVLCITSTFFIFFPIHKNPAGVSGLFPSSVEQGMIGLVISSIMLGSSLILFKYNKYPAKVFTGDVGSLTIGYGITSIAILGGQEFIIVICLLPFIINAFQMLSSIGKIVEGRKIKHRPTIILPDGKIKASDNYKAPLTLMRILLGNNPKSEKRIALDILLLTSFSGLLAIFTMVLTIFIKII